MPFNVHVTGGDEANRKLAEFRLFLEDLRSFWPLLVPIVGGWMRAQFETEGGWGGEPWAPLSPSYAIEKARTHPGRTILIREGTLRRAASEMRREATPRTLTMWIDDPVARFHQPKSADNPDGADGSRMPARPLIPDRLPQLAYREIDTAAEEYVSALVRRLEI